MHRRHDGRVVCGQNPGGDPGSGLAQAALLHRARCNSAALQGCYDAENDTDI